jgi:hypothetical protein
MGMTLYTCPDDFPARLAETLSAAGYQVTATPSRKPGLPGVVLTRPFGCQVSDGRRVLHVSGCEEKDGTLCFMIVPVWSWDPRSMLGGRRFYGAVERVLLQAGAKFVTEHEMAA